jgi:hypothetical protein
MNHPNVRRRRNLLHFHVLMAPMAGLIALIGLVQPALGRMARTAPVMGQAAAAEPNVLSPQGSDFIGEPGRTLVLPLRTIGVSETTAAVARDLLAGELETRGMPSVPLGELALARSSGSEACDDASCAARLAEEHHAARVVYGSLARLGGKIIVRIHMLRAGEAAPSYDDKFSAIGEEDLDVVMRRLAEGVATGRPNSDQATVESITRDEEPAPRRRMIRSGLGVRTGFLFPTGNSYAGADRLTNFRLVYKLEAQDFLVEASGLISWNTGDGVSDIALLDLFGARIFGLGDVAPYAGGGIGMHRVSLSRDYSTQDSYNNAPYRDQDVTALSLDVGGGLLLLRTYNWHLVFDLRYHVIFDEFKKMDGKGAHGVILSFGINH